MANAWDAGSAKLLTASGAKAIATTSAGHAFTLGLKDMGQISCEQSLSHAIDLKNATHLPVNGDFEDGYGLDPFEVARTVRSAAEVGLAGCSIEDMDFAKGSAIDFQLSVERIEAAVEAAKNSQVDFVLTARADGVMNGNYDLKEAIRRLKAFESVGADVLYAPMPVDMDGAREICASVGAPVNILAAGPFAHYTLDDFAQIGAARISLGSTLSRITHKAIIEIGNRILREGDFSGLLDGASGSEVEAIFTAVNAKMSE